jgi:hypothetical protein
MTVASCKGKTKEGQPCNARPRPGTSLCPWHTPELAGQRSEWSRTGGRNSSNRARARKELPAELLTTEELHSWLGVVFKKVITGTMDAPIATAAANVARTMAELSKTAALEDRMAEIERRLGSKAS